MYSQIRHYWSHCPFLKCPVFFSHHFQFQHGLCWIRQDMTFVKPISYSAVIQFPRKHNVKGKCPALLIKYTASVKKKSHSDSVRIEKSAPQLGLGNMAKKIITIIFFISVDIVNYHDKCQIFISFKFKPRILRQSESCRNQTIQFP